MKKNPKKINRRSFLLKAGTSAAGMTLIPVAVLNMIITGLIIMIFKK